MHGISHVTALARKPRRTTEFYQGLLGLTLARESVNPQDPHTFEQAFSTDRGEIVFHYYPRSHRGSSGTGGVSALYLLVARGSLPDWSRLLKNRSQPGERRFGEDCLEVFDPDGLPLILMESDVGSPRIGGVQLLNSSSEFWEDDLGLEVLGQERARLRLRCGEHFVELEERAEAGFHCLGYGAFHHFALAGDSSPRYLRSSCGTLCEITEAGVPAGRSERPGRLYLPQNLEPRRGEIEEVLQWTGRVNKV